MAKYFTRRGLPALATAALLGFGVTAAQASFFLPFSIDEGSVIAGASVKDNVGKFTGGYVEQLTINDDFTIDFVGVVQWAGIADVGGTGISSRINCDVPGACYEMYSVFEGSGVFTGADFAITNSSLSWFIDPSQDTTYVFNGGGADGVTFTDASGDDYVIAFANNLAVGEGVPGLPGAFLALWDDLTLTDFGVDPDGNKYFIGPRPFYVSVEATGDFDEDNFAPGDFSLTGDVSAIFRPVPTPAPIALLGLGLLGLGLYRRRAVV